MNITNSNSLLHHSKVQNDLNSDGLLSVAEMGISQEEFNSYDSNSDGMISQKELENSVRINLNSSNQNIEYDNIEIQETQLSPLSKIKEIMTTSNNETQDASTAKKLNMYVSNLDINLKTA